MEKVSPHHFPWLFHVLKELLFDSRWMFSLLSHLTTFSPFCQLYLVTWWKLPQFWGWAEVGQSPGWSSLLLGVGVLQLSLEWRSRVLSSWEQTIYCLVQNQTQGQRMWECKGQEWPLSSSSGMPQFGVKGATIRKGKGLAWHYAWTGSRSHTEGLCSCIFLWVLFSESWPKS